MRKSEKKNLTQTLSGADFDLLESNSIYIFVNEYEQIYHGGLILS